MNVTGGAGSGRRSRGATGFGIRRAAQVQRRKQLPAARQRGFDPLPADAQVRIPAQPVRIHPAAFLLRHDLRALRHQIERGDRQDKAEAGEGVGIAHERAFELKAVGFIVQEVLFNIKPPPVLLEGVHARGFITHDIPILPGTAVAGQGQRDRPELLRGNRHVVQEQRAPRSQGEIFDFAGGLARTEDA